MTAALLLTFLAIPWTSFAQSGAETSDIQEPALQPTARLTAFPLPAELCQTTLNCRRSTGDETIITLHMELILTRDKLESPPSQRLTCLDFVRWRLQL